MSAIINDVLDTTTQTDMPNRWYRVKQERSRLVSTSRFSFISNSRFCVFFFTSFSVSCPVVISLPRLLPFIIGIVFIGSFFCSTFRLLIASDYKFRATTLRFKKRKTILNLARALLGLFTHVSVWENNLENIFSCYCYMRPFWYYKKAPVLYTIHNNSGRRAFVLCCRLKRRAEGCARRRFCGGHLYIQHIDTHKRLVLYVMTTVLLHSSHHHRRDCVFHFPRRPNSFPRIGSNFFFFFFYFFPVGTLGVYSLRVEVYTIGFIYRLPHSFLWGFTRNFFFFQWTFHWRPRPATTSPIKSWSIRITDF